MRPAFEQDAGVVPELASPDDGHPAADVLAHRDPPIMRLATECLELDLLIKVDDAKLLDCATLCGFSTSSQAPPSISYAQGAAFPYSFSHAARPEQYRNRLVRDVRAAVPMALATRSGDGRRH